MVALPGIYFIPLFSDSYMQVLQGSVQAPHVLHVLQVLQVLQVLALLLLPHRQ